MQIDSDFDAGIPTDAHGVSWVIKDLEEVLVHSGKVSENELVELLTECLNENDLSLVGQVALAPDGGSYCSATVELGTGETILIEARRPP